MRIFWWMCKKENQIKCGVFVCVCVHTHKHATQPHITSPMLLMSKQNKEYLNVCVQLL